MTTPVPLLVAPVERWTPGRESIVINGLAPVGQRMALWERTSGCIVATGIVSFATGERITVSDIKPTTERCPRCWGTGYAEPSDGRPRSGGRPGRPGVFPLYCRTCGERGKARPGTGVCPPVPMRGRQSLWTPKPEDWPSSKEPHA